MTISNNSTPQATLPSELSRAIPFDGRMVVKRDGSLVKFNLERIVRAIALAAYEVLTQNAQNPARDDELLRYGLDEAVFAKIRAIAESVSNLLELFYRNGKNPGIEDIQDSVERAITAAGEWEVVRAYMAYRLTHTERRLARYNYSGLTDYIGIAKYARFVPELGRREVWQESVERVTLMHKEFFLERLNATTAIDIPPDVSELAGNALPLLQRVIAGKTVADLISSAFSQVRAKRVLPSMRSLQFGGPAVLKNNAKLFNCAFTNADRLDFFREFIWLLLSGTGVGYSVQKHHIALLPAMPKRANEDDLPVEHYTIEDSIEGWADSCHELVKSFQKGTYVQFNYGKIRPAGSPLKTSGGKAPGHLQLMKAHERVRAILQAASGRQLRSIEIYDICCFLAKAVLSGGVRRSATICLFSPDDEDMRTAKTGKWFETNPQRSASNNSAVIGRDEKNLEVFKKLFEAQKEFGEPGFYFSDHKDAGPNPCVEITLNPTIDWQLDAGELERLYQYGYEGDLPGTKRLSGIQMCNLSTINAARVSTAEEFYAASIWAAVIGTLQAAYTKMDYLGPITRIINEHDALLGVSICGIMDNPHLLLDREILETGARLVQAVNRMVAPVIGIRPAARCTAIKPEGTASLLLEAASGIHPHHARRYFRRVEANRKEQPYSFFKSINPQMTEPSVSSPTDDKIVFPVQAPDGAMLRNDITAVEFLNCVKLVQEAWVRNGRNVDNRNPELNHNVSNTCTVSADEWDAVSDFIWANRAYFTGISLLAKTGDKAYAQAPREEVSTEADIARWNSLRPKFVDYAKMAEDGDHTDLRGIVACAGGACELAV